MTPSIQDHLAHLPTLPGVYQFFDADGKMLYIGKAINLRNRVKSYFQRTRDLEPAKQIMIPQIADIKTIVVASEYEALLLESSLIYEHQPPYNILLKDDKYFKYIKITVRDRFPVITSTRVVRAKDGARYFGPYTSAWAVKETLKILKLFFPFESCTITPHQPCLEYIHGIQVGPLRFERRVGSKKPFRAPSQIGPSRSEPEYREAIRQIIDFLYGRKVTIIRDFTREMKAAAGGHNFERAAVLRDRIRSLEHVAEQQSVVAAQGGSFDVVASAANDRMAVANVLAIRGGRLLNSSNFVLANTRGQSEASVMTSFLERFYTGVAKAPREIFVAVEPETKALLEKVTKAKITVPSRGKKRKLVKMSRDNAEIHLAAQTLAWEKDNTLGREALEELAKAIGLESVPHRIETYDISNIQGTYPVGSMIVFVDGRPEKSQYRKFRIERMSTPDDFAMMREMLERRFAHLPEKETVIARSEATKQSHEWPIPDLVIIDGGKGQLSIAVDVLLQRGISIPVISLAKREEEIFIPGRANSILLPRTSKALFLIQRMRDEAHRFAITFYRKRHEKGTVRSFLDDIPGIGPVKRKLLIKTFGSLEGIRTASTEALEKAVGKHTADAIRKELR
ncbi:MAG: excinuclease ABC subunit UvrC [Candidatus Kerfeldbacteria bacterium]|nr:excinuclease ABC subunit UvrC [Candidatus Kerfeldbacteria bacterium]